MTKSRERSSHRVVGIKRGWGSHIGFLMRCLVFWHLGKLMTNVCTTFLSPYRKKLDLSLMRVLVMPMCHHNGVEWNSTNNWLHKGLWWPTHI